MRFIADLHIHSRYSIATSRDITPQSLWKWAQFKGVTVLGTGDATHPGWFKELGRTLDYTGDGLFVLREDLHDGDVPALCTGDVRFIMSAEISCIYRKSGMTRRVHCLVLMRDMESALALQKRLAKIGSITSDGRPILGLDAKKLLKIVIDECPGAVFIPAHLWTPHFSVLGSSSRFSSLEECFEELTPFVHAVETGLSSDPPMNWRVSSLDSVTLLSNSDAHSPQKIGREANIFTCGLSFDAISRAIETREGFEGTIEFFPEEGKYHLDGHRPCKTRLTPPESIAAGCRCSICGKKLTLGVLHRVEELADREAGYVPPGAKPYHSLVPLRDIIAGALGVGPQTKKVDGIYFDLLTRLGNELSILMDVPADAIAAAAPAAVSEAIARVRSGRVRIEPGYDGEYGRIRF